MRPTINVHDIFTCHACDQPIPLDEPMLGCDKCSALRCLDCIRRGGGKGIRRQCERCAMADG